MLESPSLNPALRNLLLVLLSLAAGCIDAIAFINTGVFPANMTGNTVVLAINLLRPDSTLAIFSALALAGFCGGAALGAWTVHAAGRAWSRRTTTAILAAAVLVLAATLAIAGTGERFLIPVILATSVAMGIQSAAVQQLGIAGVATVFMTGTLTAAVSRAVGAAIDRDTSHEARLPALTWAGYFTGAFAGGLHHSLGTWIPFAVPTLVLLAVAAASLRTAARD